MPRYKEAFAYHTMRRSDGWSWRCAKPNTSNYAFRVTWCPGALMLSGDVGNLVVAHYSFANPWAAASWVNGADFDYFMSKTEVSKQYSASETAAHIVERAYENLRQDPDDVKLFEAIFDEGFGYYGDPNSPIDRKAACRELLENGLSIEQAYRITDDCEIGCYRYCDSNQWKYHAFKWWANELWEKEPRWHKALRAWGRVRSHVKDLKRNWRDVVFSPVLYGCVRDGKPILLNGSKAWIYRRGKSEARYHAVWPLIIFGFNLGRIGFWRLTGTSIADRPGINSWSGRLDESSMFRDLRPEELKEILA